MIIFILIFLISDAILCMHRLVKEIVYHTCLSIGQGYGAVRFDYIPYIRDKLLSLVKTDGPDSITQVIELLDEYGLSKDDFMDTFKEFQFIIEKDIKFVDKYEAITTQQKSALTRAYNSSEHSSQILVNETLAAATVKKKSISFEGNSSRNEEGILLEDDSELVANENDDGDDDDDAIDLSKFKAKGKAKNSSANAGQKVKETKPKGGKKK